MQGQGGGFSARAEAHLSAVAEMWLNGERHDGRRESGKAHGLFEKKKGFNGTCSFNLDFNSLSKRHSGRRRVKEEDLWGEQRRRKRK